MNLIIDIGNTNVKTAVFENQKIVAKTVFKTSKIISEIKKQVKKYPIKNGIISSVASLSSKKQERLLEILPLHYVTHKTKIPFTNLYKTPKTLGVDRITVATNAIKKFPNKNVLVIDAGTCITFDFVTQNAEYLGGAIAPGIEMRLQALHVFTAKLPKVKKENINYYVGKSTDESILSGVVNGITQEIDGVIHQYKKEYRNLTVVLTGGDTNFLAKQLKSGIFAHQNFLLEGLNELLIFNTNE